MLSASSMHWFFNSSATIGMAAHIIVGNKEYDKMEVEIGNNCTIDFEAI
jgi:hypothetical protein